MQTLAELGVSLEQIVVTEMRDHTYFAELHLRRREGNVSVLSSRPSDAIALAVRVSAPIFAAEELLDEVGQEPAAEPEDEAEEILDEFRDFIEHVNPDDFVSPAGLAGQRPRRTWLAAAAPVGRRGLRPNGLPPTPPVVGLDDRVEASRVGCSHRRNYVGVACGRGWGRERS